MNVLCRNFILSDFCQICSSFFCFFRALSVGTPTFIIEPFYALFVLLLREINGAILFFSKMGLIFDVFFSNPIQRAKQKTSENLEN